MNEELRRELLQMTADDKRVREELLTTGELFDGYHPKMEKVHLENAGRLEEMIEKNGGAWLGSSTVGNDGAEAAWLIAQHAISSPDFSRRCLKLIEKAAERGEAELWHAAYLDDRINFFEGKPQRYGTQSDWNRKGKMQVWQMQDEEKVNDFRAEVGLNPLEHIVWENEETSGNAPEDFEERRREFLEWARRTGWRK